jgi:hypothetical protein
MVGALIWKARMLLLYFGVDVQQLLLVLWRCPSRRTSSDFVQNLMPEASAVGSRGSWATSC